ncbi:uncharacterized protein [Hyperolius riggenbachi]|uniref:uncharacterized protein n=1 Tax=Hyperolius riggenbachi TaxID=752182 RepID=UPI0035A3BF30
MASQQAGPSTNRQGETRAERIAHLHARMRQMSGQDQSSDSFPVNPIRDRTTPNHFDDYDRHKIGHTGWCTCQNCVNMPTGMESVCCSEIPNVNVMMVNLTCITQHPMFPQLCANEEWAQIFLFLTNNCNPVNPENKDRNRRLRKAVYRAFTGWVHGCLSKGDRRPIPSCVVKMVRQAFPDPDSRYTGFRPSNDLAAEFMVLD